MEGLVILVGLIIEYDIDCVEIIWLGWVVGIVGYIVLFLYCRGV